MNVGDVGLKAFVVQLLYAKTFSWSYKGFIKAKRKKVETNFINGDKVVDMTRLDVLDFFEDPGGKNDHLIRNIPMFVVIKCCIYFSIYFVLLF